MIKWKNKKKFFSIILFLLILIIIFKFNDINEGTQKLLFPLKFEKEVFKYSKEYGLDPYLVFAVIKVESSYDKYAVSNKNAKGLMQITDDTGLWIAKECGKEDFVVSNLFLPEVNVEMGCWYINFLSNEFDNIDIMLAAYNAGIGNVSKWLKDSQYSDGNVLIKIPYKETENYVKKVKYSYDKFKELYN